MLWKANVYNQPDWCNFSQQKGFKTHELKQADREIEITTYQRTLAVGGRITVQLVSSLTRLDLTRKKICYFVFVPSEAVESKLVNLETSHTVILRPTLSVLCNYIPAVQCLVKFVSKASKCSSCKNTLKLKLITALALKLKVIWNQPTLCSLYLSRVELIKAQIRKYTTS